MPLDEADRAPLVDMLGFAREAATFIAGRTRDDLDGDRALLRSLERALELLGECARRVSPAMRATYSDIPWQDMVGMRNILAHEYGRVDLDELWRTAQRDIPPLTTKLAAIVATFPPAT